MIREGSAASNPLSNGASGNSLNLFRLWEHAKYLDKAQALANQDLARMKDDIADLKMAQASLVRDLAAESDERSTAIREIHKMVFQVLLWGFLAAGGLVFAAIWAKTGF